MRRKCVERGHRWVESVDGFRFSVQPCRRWGCDAARPDPLMPAAVQAALAAEIGRAEATAEPRRRRLARWMGARLPWNEEER